MPRRILGGLPLDIGIERRYAAGKRVSIMFLAEWFNSKMKLGLLNMRL
jgi:hypothetical protein